jgi:hypothetical protein
MQETIKDHECVIRIVIDMNTVEKLHLEVNLESIRHSISIAPKLKIASAVFFQVLIYQEYINHLSK